MKLHLLACGTRPPDWLAAGFDDFARRFRHPLRLQLQEIPVVQRRGGKPAQRAMAEEGERLLRAVPGNTRLIALDPGGSPWSTDKLASNLKAWLADGRDVAFCIGGPDGLAPGVLERAEHRWSLGPLTLPHMLVRVVVAEQLYRAWSILENHPYHRG